VKGMKEKKFQDITNGGKVQNNRRGEEILEGKRKVGENDSFQQSDSDKTEKIQYATHPGSDGRDESEKNHPQWDGTISHNLIGEYRKKSKCVHSKYGHEFQQTYGGGGGRTDPLQPIYKNRQNAPRKLTTGGKIKGLTSCGSDSKSALRKMNFVNRDLKKGGDENL